MIGETGSSMSAAGRLANFPTDICSSRLRWHSCHVPRCQDRACWCMEMADCAWIHGAGIVLDLIDQFCTFMVRRAETPNCWGRGAKNADWAGLGGMASLTTPHPAFPPSCHPNHHVYSPQSHLETDYLPPGSRCLCDLAGTCSALPSQLFRSLGEMIAGDGGRRGKGRKPLPPPLAPCPVPRTI